MALILGLDEAGRGPVIGPLVLAGVLIEEKDESKLIKLGVKDSKLLTPSQRERLFDKIKKSVKAYKILVVEPGEIDNAVDGENKLNLNWLEGDKSVEIIKALKPDTAYLDCPSNNIRKYTEYVKDKLPKEIEIIAEHKADVTYPVVSAASILAKVTRDRAIQEIQSTVHEPLGSGYPSDLITVEFLKKNYKRYPHIFRKSWMSYKNVADVKKQRSLKEF